MNEIITKLRDELNVWHGFAGVSFQDMVEFTRMEVPKENLLEVAKYLRDAFGFSQLVDAVGVDRFTKVNRFEMIYNLWNIDEKLRLFIRVKLDSKKPEVETLTSVWTSADWYEREAYDMYGIIFTNHPDLRRMYMIQDYEYYPLRKDYPLMGLPGASVLPNAPDVPKKKQNLN